MELITVNVPHRARPARINLTDRQVGEGVEMLYAGQAVAPSDTSFGDRRDAQTEAWRWRHEFATRGGLDVASLKSVTFSDDGHTYRFAIYAVAEAAA